MKFKSQKEIEDLINNRMVFKDGYGIEHYSEALKRAVEILNKTSHDGDYRKNLLQTYDNPRQILEDDSRKYRLDPDWRCKRIIENFKCNADALLPFYWISNGKSQDAFYENNDNDIIHIFEHYRKVPIFYFPLAKNEKWPPEPDKWHDGINSSRGDKYHDRIDLFLFDLKLWFKYYYDEKDKDKACSKCKMHKCYLDEITETEAWLDALNEKSKTKGYTNGFEYLMDKVYDVKGIFVDESFNVYNIESNEIIEESNWEDVKEGYWTKTFYVNLKAKIDAWYERQGFFSN